MQEFPVVLLHPSAPGGLDAVTGIQQGRLAALPLLRDRLVDPFTHPAAAVGQQLLRLLGSVNLINASVNNGVKCFVFTSSIAVYGANQTPMTEDLEPEPEDR